MPSTERHAARSDTIPLLPDALEYEKLRLAALFDIGQTICSSLNEQEILGRILQTTREIMGAQISTLRLLDERGELRLAAQLGAEIFNFPIRLGESIVGRAVAEKRPYVIQDIGLSHYKNTALAGKLGLKSLLSVPLLLKDQAVGGLTIYSRMARSYDAGDVSLLMSIASQAAVAIQNATLFRDTLHTLVSMARAIEAKDAYTQGHSQRVSDYAIRIARRAGLPREQLALIEQMCPVHDIGKVGISEAIINKPGSLSEHEFLIIQRHPVIGANILGPVHVFKQGLSIVRNHHERLDGNGYPDGLAGDDISPVVRVATIADCYDAMTSRRPYRDPLSRETAIAELRNNKNTQFDADFVDIFVELLTGDEDA